MVDNEHAALRLAHPTVVPVNGADDQTATREPETDAPDVDVTGSHPTVRAAPRRGD